MDAPAPATRTVAHFDLDTFFVSVERRRDPRLQGVPLMVGGSSDRGVVAACSYETRKFGVHAGMPMRHARRLCPHAHILHGDFQAYAAASNEVRQVVSATAPVLEFASIDEFYLDLTGMDRFFGSWQFVQALRRKVMHETGLPLSMGLANCKAVAKIATGQAKPCGELHVARGTETAFLAPLPVQKIPGAGDKACDILHSLDIHTVGQLQAAPLARVEDALGRWGRSLWYKAHAADDSPVVAYSERKQVGTEETFDHDTADAKALLALLVSMVEQVAFQLRASGRLTGCLTVKLRYANFDTHTQQSQIPFTDQDGPLIQTAKALFLRLHRAGAPLRLIGVAFSHLMPCGQQLSLLQDTLAQTALLRATDHIRRQYGAHAVHRAVTCFAAGRRRGTRGHGERMSFDPDLALAERPASAALKPPAQPHAARGTGPDSH